MPEGSKRTAAIAFAVLLVGVVVLIAATEGIGKPSLPDDAVAYIEDAPDPEVTQEQYDAALEQAAARQQIRQVPEPGTPQYDLIKETAMSDLLLSRWVSGEAEDLGIEVTDQEIDEELETIIDQQFGGQQQFDRFLEQSKFTEEDARERVRLQLLSQRIQQDVLGTEPPEISEDEVQAYYNDNIEQFETPETRDVRQILNPDAAQAQDAFDQLSEDDSPANWKKVAKQLSTDEATSGLGGVRQGVAEGQSDPALDEAIFGASEGELIGPIETGLGNYVVQVETINPASTQDLDDQTRQQIEQTLAAEQQQQAAADYQADFLAKWSVRTVCADEVTIDRCGNPPPAPDPCQGDDEGEEETLDPTTQEPVEGCPAFVPSTQPVPPTNAGNPNATGLPQGPQLPQAEVPALPTGTQTIPGVPEGTVPTTPGGG